ncbi:hypothetical protein EDF64_110129 [Curtobacterium flaccumfaciens]|uniref:Flagellar protein FlgN n=1 Tax=Curtobacterium flaccumfaciens TaxID=2035 RepID=A0A4R6DFS2_9MICO|nr:hypothetical protein [Curtobacterium flaccumfaciens]TDN42868.1 hypothetical protein EDF64_110129 [Curtobacterium flaccumfaciens]
MSPEPSGDLVADRARWEAVLDQLELDAGQTADPATAAGWSEPSGLGPIPRELVGRASRLLAAQRDRIAALEAGRRSAGEHLGALRAVDATREPRGSVYLDASA